MHDPFLNIFTVEMPVNYANNFNTKFVVLMHTYICRYSMIFWNSIPRSSGMSSNILHVNQTEAGVILADTGDLSVFLEHKFQLIMSFTFLIVLCTLYCFFLLC